MLVKVELSGGQPSRVIDINANVVEQKLELSFPNGGGEEDKVPFGTIYYGMKKQVKAVLTNNGPHTTQFNVNVEEVVNEEEVGIYLFCPCMYQFLVFIPARITCVRHCSFRAMLTALWHPADPSSRLDQWKA